MYELVMRCQLTGETMAPIPYCQKHLNQFGVQEGETVYESETDQPCLWCIGDKALAKYEDLNP